MEERPLPPEGQAFIAPVAHVVGLVVAVAEGFSEGEELTEARVKRMTTLGHAEVAVHVCVHIDDEKHKITVPIPDEVIQTLPQAIASRDAHNAKASN